MDLKTAPGKPLPSLKDERRYNSQAVSPQILGERSKQNDVGNQNTMAKVEVSTTRPCAVIEPDRIIPQPAHKNESYMGQSRSDTWPYPDNTFNKYGIANTKPGADSHMPPRNISPRQTFQENMQRFMTQPRLDILKGNDPAAIIQADKTVTSLKNVRVNPTIDPKYCDVPYVVNPLQSDHRPRMIRNSELYTTGIPQGVIPSQPHWSSAPVQVNPYAAYGPSELNRYQEYPTCTVPRTSVVSHQPRGPPEEPAAYPESYFRGGDVRYEPYPSSKDKYQRTRYDYVSNYATPCPPYYHPPKYDIPKNLSLPAYVGYNHPPYKYTDPRMVDYSPEPYSRQQPQFPNYPDPVQAKYSASTGNVQNKMCSYPIDSNQLSNTKVPYNTNRIFTEYESNRFKVPVQEPPYLSNEMQHYQIKPQVPIHNHINSDNMKPPPYAYYYRNEGPMMRNIGPSYPSRYRNYDPSQFGCHNPLAKIPIQFSPNVISPSGSNTSNDSMLTHSTSQEDYGYVSQCSTASGKSVDSTYLYPNDIYRKSDRLHFNPNMQSTINRNFDVKEKPVSKTLKDKNLDVRQFLQMWDEEFEEVASIHKAPSIDNDRQTGNSKQEQLYVLGMVNVSSEELQKYEHIQKVSKLPENIKGYDNVELLRQFDAVFGPKEPPTSHNQDHKKPKILQPIMPERPISPLDVEAKISQSVIHKEVGCNFEIKPCSPSKVDVTRPQIPISVMSERRIERVLNCQDKIIKSITDLEMKKSVDKRKLVQNLEDTPSPKIKRVGDCKVANSIKPEYISKEYQNISSVSLDSLPRLDTEIDLNFQEVNQQFVNSQNSCHTTEKKCSGKVIVLPFNDTNIENVDRAAQDLQHFNETHSKDTNKPKSVLLSNPLPRTDTVIKKNLPVSNEYIANQSPNNHLSNQPSNEAFDHESLLYNFNGFHSPPTNQVDNHLSPMNLTSDSANYLSECVNESKNNEVRPIPKCESFSDSISINVAINLSIHSNNPDVYNTNAIQSIQSSNSSGVTLERPLQDNNSIEPYLNEVSSTINPCEDTINEINLPILDSGPKTDNATTISSHHEIDFGSVIANNDMNHGQLDLACVKNEGTFPNDSEPISDMHQFQSSETLVRNDVQCNKNKCLPKTDLEETMSASCISFLNTECSYTRIHINKKCFESSKKRSISEYCINHSNISYEDNKTVGEKNQQLDAHTDHTNENVSIMSSPKKRHLKAPRSVECIFDSISGKIILKTGKKISSQKRRNAVNDSELSQEVAHPETQNLSLISPNSLYLKARSTNEEQLINDNSSSDNSHTFVNLHTSWNDSVKVIEKHGDEFNHKTDLQAPSTSLPNMKTSTSILNTKEEIDICKQHYDGISIIESEPRVPKPNIRQQSFEISNRNQYNVDQTIDCLINNFNEHDSGSNSSQSTVITLPPKISPLKIIDENDSVVKSPTIDRDMTLDMTVCDDSNDTNIITPSNTQDHLALLNLSILDLPKSVTNEKAQPYDLFSQKTQRPEITITDSLVMESKKVNQTPQNFKPKQSIKKIKLKAKKIKGTFKDKKLIKTNSIIIKKEVGHLKLKLSLRGIKRTSIRSKKPRKKKYYIVNESTLLEETESIENREKSSSYEKNHKGSAIPKDTENISLLSPKAEPSIESSVSVGSFVPEASSQSQRFVNEDDCIKQMNIEDVKSQNFLINIEASVESEKNIFCANENEMPHDLTPQSSCQQVREVTSDATETKNIPKIICPPSNGELIHRNNSCTRIDIPSTTISNVTGYIVNDRSETCGTKLSLNEDSGQTQIEPRNITFMTGEKLESPFDSLKPSLCHNLRNPISPKEISSEDISENSIEHTDKYKESEILSLNNIERPGKIYLVKENSLQGELHNDLKSITGAILQDDSCLQNQASTLKFQTSDDIAEGVKNILENRSRYVGNGSPDDMTNKQTTENLPAQYTSSSEITETEKASLVLEEITVSTIEKSKDQEVTRARNIEFKMENSEQPSDLSNQNLANDSGLQNLVQNKAVQSEIARPIDAKDFCKGKTEPIETYNVEIKCDSLKQPLEQLSTEILDIENNSKEILSNIIGTNEREGVASNNQENEGISVLVEIESGDIKGKYEPIKLKKTDPWQEGTLTENIIDPVASSYNIQIESKCEPSDDALKKTSIDCAIDEKNTEFACFKNTATRIIENVTTSCEDSKIHSSVVMGSLSVETIKKEEPEKLEECLSYCSENETNIDNKKTCTLDTTISVIIEKKEHTQPKEPFQEDILTETVNCRDANSISSTYKNDKNHSPLADDFKTNTNESCSMSSVIFPHEESKSNTMKHENTCELLSNDLEDCTYDCFLDEDNNGDREKRKDIMAIISDDSDKSNSEKLGELQYDIFSNESKKPQMWNLGPEDVLKNDNSTSLDCLFAKANMAKKESSKTEIANNTHEEDSKIQSKEKTAHSSLNNKDDSLDISSHEYMPCVSRNENNVEIMLSARIPGDPNDVRDKQVSSDSDCNQNKDVKATNTVSNKDQQIEDAFIKSSDALNGVKPVDRHEMFKTTNSQNYTPRIHNLFKTVSSLTTDKSSNLETDAISSTNVLFKDTKSIKILADKENCNTIDLIVVPTQSEGQQAKESFSKINCTPPNNSEIPPKGNNNLHQNIFDSENHEAISNVVPIANDLTASVSTNQKENISKSKNYSNIYIKCSSDARSEAEDHIFYENSLARLVHDYPSPIETTENREFANTYNKLQTEKNDSKINFNLLDTEKLSINSMSICRQLPENEKLEKMPSLSERSEGTTLLENNTEIHLNCDSLMGLAHDYKSPLYDFASDSIDHQAVANKLYNELWSYLNYRETLDQKFQTVDHETDSDSSKEVMKTNIDSSNDNDYLSKNMFKHEINENKVEIETFDSEPPSQDVPRNKIDENNGNITKSEMDHTLNTTLNKLSEVSQCPVTYQNCAHHIDHTRIKVPKTLCTSRFDNPQLDNFESTLHQENFDKSTFCPSSSKHKESFPNLSENYRAVTLHFNESENFRETDSEESDLKERQSLHNTKIKENENSYGSLLPYLLNENMNHIKVPLLPAPKNELKSNEISKHSKEKKNKSKKPSKRSSLLPKLEDVRGYSKELMILHDSLLDGTKDNLIALRQNEKGVQEQYVGMSNKKPNPHSKIDESNYLFGEDIITNIDSIKNTNESAIQTGSFNLHNNDFVIETESNFENDYVVLTSETNNLESSKLNVDIKDHNVSYSDTNFKISDFVASDVEPDEILSMNTISKEICLEPEYIVADALEIHESVDSIITDGLCFLYHDDSEVVLSSESTGCTSGIAENSNLEYSYNNHNETCESVHISPDIWIDDIACVETVVTEGSNIDNVDLYDLCVSPKEFSDKSSEVNESCEFIPFVKTIDIETNGSISSHGRNNNEFAQKCLETSQNYENTFLEKSKTHSKPETLKTPSSVFASNTVQHNNGQSRLRCKFTEKSHYSSNIRNYSFNNNFSTVKPLITKAAQKYIPPLKVAPDGLKVRLQLPKEMLKQLREYKERKMISMRAPSSVIEQSNCDSKNKRNKPKFEDVLKNIDKFQSKVLTHTKAKKKRHNLQQVDMDKIKYCSGKEENLDNTEENDSEQLVEGCKRSPDLTGLKWQPWVFLEKNSMIEKMILGMKTSAIYCTKKNQIILPGNIKSRRKSVPAIFKSKNRESLKHPSVYSRPL